jgi:protein-S-isoprenylcysteine O-methyltransferase Ste14
MARLYRNEVPVSWSGMDVVLARVTVVAAAITMVAIRAPHGHRSRAVKVVRSARGRLEAALLLFAWVSFFLPLFWAAAPRRLLSFADYPLRPAPYFVGLATLVISLYAFHRSHADLGTNWSITLEVREHHTLVTSGVYRRIRHPMYAALLLYAVGQALVLPNWVAGPSYLAAMVPLVACRLRPEERLMKETFGADYDAYVTRTKRLIPGVW